MKRLRNLHIRRYSRPSVSFRTQANDAFFGQALKLIVQCYNQSVHRFTQAISAQMKNMMVRVNTIAGPDAASM